MLSHHKCSSWTVAPAYVQRLISLLQWRGWYKVSLRGNIPPRMWRNGEYIEIGLQGEIVAHGPMAQAVLQELARTQVLQ